MYRRPGLILSCLLLAACTSSHLPAPAPSFTASQRHVLQPEGASGLPAEGASGMPAGDFLLCNLHDTPGQVDCTIAINLYVSPNGDPNTPADLLPGLHPDDLRSAYELPSSRKGGTVAIVDAYDDPVAEADLAIYRTTFSLPACGSSNGCFRRVNEYGQTTSYPLPNLQWDQEISLDLDMVSAVCPNCKILLLEANTPSIDDLGTAVDTAASMGAVAISNSYYAQEWPNERYADRHYKHPGVAVVAATGDQPASYYPSASPYVTSVGGTTLTLNPRNEAPWAPAGQGCSVYEPKPSWQTTNLCTTRSVVDVTAVADPQTGTAFWDSASGGWLVAGGTSIGTPLVAAAYALSHNPRGPQYSYARPSDFFDIPPPGYDLATGLGSPAGVAGF